MCPDVDDEYDDQGPSEEDIARFAGDEAFCPDCGALIWDQAEICPKCHAYIGGNATSRSPVQRWVQHRWTIVVVILLLIAFLLCVL